MTRSAPWLLLLVWLVVGAAALAGSHSMGATSSGPPRRQQSTALKVICWNVLYGFNHQDSVEVATDWFRGERPDVLALQELNGFTQESFGSAAASWGHGHAALQKETGFSLGLTSTAPIEVIERRVEGFHHGFLHCRTHGIHFLVVHFWPGKEHELDVVLEIARALVDRGEHVMVLGDFNSHSPRDAAFLAGTAVEPRYGQVRAMEKAGFIDVVQRHDREAPYSCPSPITIPKWSKDLAEVASKRQRIDFLFVNPALAALSRSGRILRSKVTEQVSDHYPLVAEFTVLPSDWLSDWLSDWPSDWPSVPPKVRFGAIADCQYCAAETRGQRYYAQSPRKLKACVEHLGSLELDYVVHLGDFIDRDYESFDVVLPIFEGLTCAKHQVLGNHDFEVADEHKAKVPGRLGMPSRYYDFAVKDWRFVVLDGNDISLHAHPKGSPEHAAAVEYKSRNAPSAASWNGAMGPAQLKWLASTLSKAAQAGESVILFSHFPVYPSDVHNLWNSAEVLELIDAHPCVKAYINGHHHAGSYEVRGGVHFLTLKGMVDTTESSYAVIEIFAERLRVLGFGREIDRIMTLR